MKLSRSLIANALLLILMLLTWGPIALQAADPNFSPVALEYQLLTNPGMEAYDPAYDQFEGVNCQVATGWHRFSYAGPEPCFLDTRVFAGSQLGGGWVERIEGDTSQMIISTEPYAAGLWQQVTGITPGAGYGFHAAMLTIFQTSAQEPTHGTMIKDVGIDPTGGTDPQAHTVVWSEPDARDQVWDVGQRVSLYAQGASATVFIRVTSPSGAGPWPYMNQSFLDSAILARTTSAVASSPAESEATSFVVRWSHGDPAPGVLRVRWYDIQWMDEADGVWQDWLTEVKVKDGKVSETFVGQRGHTYRFRARVFQKYENGAHLYSPYRPAGDTQTYVKGPELTGRVWDNNGRSMGGATVSILGTSYTATNGQGGDYRIRLLPTSQAHTVAVEHPTWSAPAPVHGVTFGPAETVIIDWTLAPPDDGVANGGFESGLDGWSPQGEGGGAPAVAADPIHTGYGALALSGQEGGATMAGVTQTVELAGSWEPALSLWYRPQSSDPDDRFNIVLTSVVEAASPTPPVLTPHTGAQSPEPHANQAVTTTYVFTPSLASDGWQHVWYYPGPPEAYFTGTVMVHLRLEDDGDAAVTSVYLDEVSLGRTMGGPFRSYLPLVRKSH
jgi:hypothetical protein